MAIKNRIPLIAANWKMNLNINEAKKLSIQIDEFAKKIKFVEFIILPTFIHLPILRNIFTAKNIALGSQNISHEPKGAYTGEIAAFQVKDIYCTHVLVGHSERRYYFNEDYEIINKKIKVALELSLNVILCIGESKEEREITEMVLIDQIESAFQDIQKKNLKSIIIAYEPIWAIGTGLLPTAQNIAHMHQIIRKTLQRLFNNEIASTIRILYGGSVSGSNIKDLMEMQDIDGALVGGCSLKFSSFQPIMNFNNEV